MGELHMTTITTSDGKTIKVIPESERDSNLTPSEYASLQLYN